MKLTILKESFLKAMQMVQPIISSHPAKPIMANVHIMAEKGRVYFMATDDTVTLRCSVEAEVSEEGTSTFNARRLLNVVRELPEDKVLFAVDDKDWASIRCGSSSSKLYGLPPDEFPVLPSLEGTMDFTLEQTALKQMLQNTAYAASGEENRQVLNGVMMTFREGKAVVVATDGRRLALMEQEIEVPAGKSVEMIIPTKTVGEWVRTLQDEGQVKVLASAKMAGIEFGDLIIISKLVEGTYPNYRQVIPAKCEERVTIPREELLAALRRVSAITDRGVSVKLSFRDNELKITSVAPDVGEAEETLPIKYSGKGITIAFNPEFLMDPVRNLVCDEIYFEMVDNLNPGVIKCDIPFLYVIMPQRLV